MAWSWEFVRKTWRFLRTGNDTWKNDGNMFIQDNLQINCTKDEVSRMIDFQANWLWDDTRTFFTVNHVCHTWWPEGTWQRAAGWTDRRRGDIFQEWRMKIVEGFWKPWRKNSLFSMRVWTMIREYGQQNWTLLYSMARSVLLWIWTCRETTQVLRFFARESDENFMVHCQVTFLRRLMPLLSLFRASRVKRWWFNLQWAPMRKQHHSFCKFQGP